MPILVSGDGALLALIRGHHESVPHMTCDIARDQGWGLLVCAMAMAARHNMPPVT